jgi:sterol desaturase/sphingolipid hydroxylase (fatty acid hydroxylase superfamily)
MLALVALASAIIAGYGWGWAWIGVGAATETTDATRGSDTTRTVRLVGPKTLWDWMSFLIVPLVLAIGGYLYHRNQQHADRLRAEHQDHTERARTQARNRPPRLP